MQMTKTSTYTFATFRQKTGKKCRGGVERGDDVGKRLNVITSWFS